MKQLIRVAVFGSTLLVSGLAFAGEQSVTLNVTGMTCASCPYMVKQSLAKVEGVTSVEVSMTEQNAKVTYDDAKCSVTDLTTATENVGFPSEPIAQGG